MNSSEFTNSEGASPRHHLRLTPAAVLLAVATLTAACSGSLFKVKPATALAPLPENAATINLGSVSFRAAALLTDEETQELFDSNFQLAGLLPVRVQVAHNSGEAVDLSKVHFRLHDNSGTEWKTITYKRAISRILKANGVSIYTPDSRKTFEKEFRAYELDLKTPLTHAERHRQGVVIFLSPKKTSIDSPHGLVLAIDGLAQPAALNLN
jgi:hypothetical protein